MYKVELNTATQEDEQQNSIDEEIEAEIKSFLATENLSAETEEDKGETLTSFARKYLAAQSSSIILKDYFLKLVICTRKSLIYGFQRSAKKKLFSTLQLEKKKNGLL